MVEFYHYLFYKSYLWQVKVMKEIDYPIYSAVIMITFILSLNYSMIYEFVSYFIYHNRWTWEYPWVYYFPLGALFVLNYIQAYLSLFLIYLRSFYLKFSSFLFKKTIH